MVTIKTLAKECGLSIAAVSKALHGQPGVGPEKAELVRRTARELGYSPNAAARTLKTNRSYNIGILFKNALAHEFFSLVLESIREAAEAQGYDITFLSNHVDAETGYYEHARYRRCDGVIIVQGNFDFDAVRYLVESDIPVVSVEQVYNGHTSIVSDNVGSMEAIVQYLHRQGHQRLAFIHGEMGDVTRSRLAGFHRGCRSCRIEAREDDVIQARFNEPEDSAEAACRLMKKKTPPDCILFPDDICCTGGITALREAGFSVPEDVSCFGFDGIRLANVMSPSLATYRQNTAEIGRLAAEELITAIEDPKCYIPRVITVPGEIQPGGSVKDLADIQ